MSESSIQVEIGKVFHLTHVVADLDAAEDLYTRVFGGVRLYRAYAASTMRTACLTLFADMVVEPMQTSTEPGADQTAIGKFFKRFGERMYGIAWYVPDLTRLVAAHDALRAAGIRRYATAGGALDECGERTAFFTHPKDTPGMLEFAVPGYMDDPRLHPGWSAREYEDSHPLGIVRTARITFVVSDLAKALAVFTSSLGGTPLDSGDDAERRFVQVCFGDGPDVELVQPLDALSAESRALADGGDGIYSVTFEAKDLERAAGHLVDCGLSLSLHTPSALAIDPGNFFGLRFNFVEQPRSRGRPSVTATDGVGQTGRQAPERRAGIERTDWRPHALTSRIPAYEQVSAQLRDAIVRGRLEVGDVLPGEAELARHFAVSRSTVREALRLLASQGFIRTTRGVKGGSTIAHPSQDGIQEYMTTTLGLLANSSVASVDAIVEARELIEIPATALAAQRRAVDIVGYPSSATIAKSNAIAPQLRSDQDFHILLVQASGNPFLETMLRPFLRVLHTTLRGRFPESLLRQLDEEHAVIAAAVNRGDAEAASEAMRTHLRTLREVYVGVIPR